MPMNPALFAQEKLTAYENAGKLVGLSASEKTALKASWEFDATLLFSHLTANMVVTTSVTVASVSGVTTGPGISGPGAGSGSGTVA